MTRVETGRKLMGRADGRNAYCPSCDVRMVYGEPNSNGEWTARLRLTEEQLKLLVLAAAESDAISKECGKCSHRPHPDHVCLHAEGEGESEKTCYCIQYRPRGQITGVDFVDWLTPDALGRTGDPPHFDGRKPRPGMAGTSTNRHADPIPWGGREAAKLVER